MTHNKEQGLRDSHKTYGRQIEEIPNSLSNNKWLADLGQQNDKHFQTTNDRKLMTSIIAHFLKGHVTEKTKKIISYYYTISLKSIQETYTSSTHNKGLPEVIFYFLRVSFWGTLKVGCISTVLGPVPSICGQRIGNLNLYVGYRA